MKPNMSDAQALQLLKPTNMIVRERGKEGERERERGGGGGGEGETEEGDRENGTREGERECGKKGHATYTLLLARLCHN